MYLLSIDLPRSALPTRASHWLAQMSCAPAHWLVAQMKVRPGWFDPWQIDRYLDGLGGMGFLHGQGTSSQECKE